MGLGSFFKNLFGSAKEKASDIADKTENFVEESYEKAKELATPVINSFNEKAKEIAKKYGKRPIKKTFAGCFR